MKHIQNESELDDKHTYLVLWKRWTGDEPAVTPEIVDCTNWFLATWDSNCKKFVTDDGSGHYCPPEPFENFERVYKLSRTHTELKEAGL